MIEMINVTLAGNDAPLCFVDELSTSEIKQLQQDAAQCAGLVQPFFRDNLQQGGSGPELAIIPAGRFEMGSTASEYGHRREEAPRHPTLIRKPFAIGVYPILAEEFEQFRRATEWFLRPELIWHKGRYPVINVRIQDIKLYLQWLSEQTEQTYRLPTEAEWEYAARAGTVTPFYHGEDVSCKEVHFNPLFPYKEPQEKRRWYLPRCMPSI